MIFYPNLYALAQELVQKKEYVKINSFIEIQGQLINIAAAICCALLLSGSHLFFSYFNIELFGFKAWDIEKVFLLNSLLYLITCFILKPIKYKQKKIIKLPSLKSSVKERK